MTEVKLIGNIDEAGFLKNFARQGFSIAKCLGETIANSLDAMQPDQQKRIHFQQKNEDILMIDNACGMNSIDLQNMYAAHFENHSSHRSRGVSGIGGKIAQYHLSGKTKSTVFTHQKGGPYLKVFAPWDEMLKKGKYTSMFRCAEMTEEEISVFNQERFENGMVEEGDEAVGTTLVFPYNDPLYECVLENFQRDEDKKSHLDATDRIGVIFGREENLSITAELADLAEGYKEMEFYNYFGGRVADYYDGISREIVHLYTNKSGEPKFIWKKSENKDYEVRKVGKGYSRDIKEVEKEPEGFKFQGEYEILTGLRRQEGINPKDITGEKKLGNYDKHHIGENDTFLTHHKVVRNNQCIGLIEPEVKIGNARANKLSNLEIYQVQTEIRFNPLSSQDNVQDHITGVQQNKNQFNGKNLPKNFTRLIHKIRMDKCKSIEKFLGLDKSDNRSVRSKEDNQSLVDVDSEREEVLDSVIVPTQVQPENIEGSVFSEDERDFRTISPSAASQTSQTNESEENSTLVEPLVEPVVEPLVEPLTELVAEPVSELATEPTVEPVVEEEQRPRLPIEVKSHRKGWVSGEELRDELMRLHSQIAEDASFTDPSIIEFFNTLRNIKIGV